MRSLPEAWSSRVMQTSMSPQPRNSRATRSSSVATTTWAAPACPARAATRRIIDSPSIFSSGLPGRRVEPKRAGTTTTNGGIFSAMTTSVTGRQSVAPSRHGSHVSACAFQLESHAVGEFHKTGKRGGDVGAIADGDRRRRHEPGDGEAHGDTVIAMAVDRATAYRAALDHRAIGQFVDLYAAGL